MHYGGYSFSVNDERTILTKDEKYQNLIGNRATFTANDMNYIDLLYNYNKDDVGIVNCSCNEFDISGFQIQRRLNGFYKRKDSLFNDRNSHLYMFLCFGFFPVKRVR